MSGIGERFAHLPPLQRAYLAMEQMQARLDADERARTEPIAIVGIGCRFPGGADSPEAFWHVLRDGVDTIRTAPPGRWDDEAIARVLRDLNPAIDPTVRAGFVDHVDQFDAAFFDISPREAACMDPQQRLLLEVAWEALEDAGQTRAGLAGSRTGVFVGIHGQSNDYFWLQAADGAHVDVYTATGTALSVMAGRLSYLLDLTGPSIAVDTACSSSLVAVHQAVQSLRGGECTLAVAAGVNLRLAPPFLFATSKMGTASASGRCRAFDAGADGIVFGEGCGAVVLKRASEAVAAGDRIWALIRGSAVNQDGRSAGLTAPNLLAQQAVIREALENAGVAPAQIGFVEAHGTGTPLGDPIEIEALAEVFRQDTSAHGATAAKDEHHCAIGSVKTNMGHLEGAAGIAGLIKVVLALHNQAIPPNLHFQQLNPHISLEGTPFVIPTALLPWPSQILGATSSVLSSSSPTPREHPRSKRPEGTQAQDSVPRPRCAGVSSFGWSGTNAHIVLEEAPSPDHPVAPIPTGHPVQQETAGDHAYLLPVSARSPQALKALAASYEQLLRSATDEPAGALRLQDLCYTAGVRRTHHEYRLAVAGGSPAELASSLQAFVEKAVDPNPKSVVFVFPGQGSQWDGMGRELMLQEPVFRKELERCDHAIRAETGWSVIAALTGEEGSGLDRIDVIQPALFSIEVALAALWRSWGIVPDAVIGHSMGEVAAAHVAGILSLPDAVRIICRRSSLLRRVSGMGAMATVELSMIEAQAAIAGYEDRVSVAVSNGPRSTVLSGDPVALQEVVATLQRRDVFCRWIKVDVAAHSPQVDRLATDLLAALDGLQPKDGAVPFYSTVTVGDGGSGLLDASYWLRNLRSPVLFWPSIERLLADGHGCFVEISPHPILVPTIEQGLREAGEQGSVVGSLRRDQPERAVLVGSLGTLYSLGHDVDWTSLFPEGGRCVRLPAYPWQRERYWLENTHVLGATLRSASTISSYPDSTSVHPLLGRRVEASVQPGTFLWEIDLSIAAMPYLGSHRIDGLAVLPATAYLEMALAGAEELFAGSPLAMVAGMALQGVSLMAALVLPEQGARTVQLAISVEGPGTASWQIASRASTQSESRPEAQTGPDESWTVHATGTLRRDPAGPASDRLTSGQIRSRCTETTSGSGLYRRMERQGLGYGPEFRGVEWTWRRDGEAIGLIKAPEAIAGQAQDYQLHPALFDACLQMMAAAAPRDGEPGKNDAYVPVGMREVRLLRRASTTLWSHAVATVPGGGAGEIEADVRLLDEDGETIGYVRGLRVRRLEGQQQKPGVEEINDCFYGLDWILQPLPEHAAQRNGVAPGRPGTWLILAGRRTLGTDLQEQLEAHGDHAALVAPGQAFRALGVGQFEIDPVRPDDYRRLLAGLAQDDPRPLRGVLYLSTMDQSRPDETRAEAALLDPGMDCQSVVYLVQALAHAGLRQAPRLLLVTRGAQAVGADEPIAVAHAPLWGLGRTIAYEHPELDCTLVDLASQPEAGEIVALCEELRAGAHEEQVVLRGGNRYVARLARRDGTAEEDGDISAPLAAVPSGGEQAFRLEIGRPGDLDSLRLRATSRRAPGPGEVEVEVSTAGLNFLDVLLALGLLLDDFPGAGGTGPRLGGEVAGRVVATGEGVTDLVAGQEVLGLASWSFGRFVTTSRARVVPKPAQLTFEEAATIPIAFATAYHALHHVAHLAKGERVLIHAAAGGVGLAAVQLAQQLGAEIFATAGTDEKRAFLRALGVPHVMDSRSLSFADGVRDITGGEGVDVVLNSLAGPFIPASLGLLRDHGRFVELGKRDYYDDRKLGLRPFLRGLSFTLVDLLGISLKRPAYFTGLLQYVVDRFEAGELKPIVHRVFPIGDVKDAFQLMAQAGHIGKIVVSVQKREELLIVPEPQKNAHGGLAWRASGDESYLITGGVGALGLAVGRWMVERGARNLVLVGRHGPSAAAQAAITEMEELGAHVITRRADVAAAEALAGVFQEIDRRLPPLRGIIHAAALLDDAMLLQLTPARFKTVMEPKIAGAWNLHRLTRDRDLDFFVLFSSAASLLGAPGQGNYAAANAFLDALAHHRRAAGLPAVSINWGPWAGAGLAAVESNRGQRLAQRGSASLSVEQGLAALERCLGEAPAQVGVMRLNLRQWRQFYPKTAQSHLFDLIEQDTAQHARSTGTFRAVLLAAEPQSRRALLEGHLIEQLTQVLRVDRSRIDSQRPLNTLGFDSLMALELRNRLEASLGLTLPATLVWGYPTIEALAPSLASRLELALDPAPGTEATVPAQEHRDGTALDQALAGVDQLSDDGALAALLGRSPQPGVR